VKSFLKEPIRGAKKKIIKTNGTEPTSSASGYADYLRGET
jgi:hypothetical protein